MRLALRPPGTRLNSKRKPMVTPDAVQRFLIQLRADGRSPHTVGQYRRHLRLLGEWWARESPGADLGALTHEAVAAFLTSDEALLRPDGEPKAATTMNALRSSVRGFFGYLERSGQLASNPARVVRMARVPENPPDPLKAAEVERLLGALAAGELVSDRRDHALFAFLLATGARLSSSLALDVGDLDLDASEARLTKLKGGGRLTVFLTPAVVGLLRLAVGERRSGPVFVARGDGRLSARHVQRRFGHWLEVAGLPRRYSPHSLRHTFAMELYQRTGDLLVVKEALGHRSIASTMVYARAGAERVRAAVLG